MKLTDIASLEKWMGFEKEIRAKSGLNAAVFDTKGMRITDYKEWANELCPVIKSNDNGQTFICSLAHQNTSAQAMKAKKAIIEECDAGLVKLVVPIFVNDEFLGVAGGCGLLAEDGEVDPFLIHKTTGIDEEKLEALSENIATIDKETLSALSDFISKRLNEIIQER